MQISLKEVNSRERDLPFLGGQKFHLFFTTLWVGIIIKFLAQGHIAQFLLVQRKCKTHQWPLIFKNQWKHFSFYHLASILAMSIIIFLKSFPLTPWNLSFFHTGPSQFSSSISLVVGIPQKSNHSILLHNVSPGRWHFSTPVAQTNGNDSPKYWLPI